MEIPKLKVETFPTANLVPYAHNAKKHPAEQIHQIATSISQFGFNDPVAVWTNAEGDLEIVEGHGRVLAAQELGIDKLPIIRLDHLDDDARRAYTHVHNQLTLNSGFDIDIVQKEIESLPAFDWESFGFVIQEVAEILKEQEIVEPLIPDEPETRTKSGDLWRLGEHFLLCGDSTNSADIDKLMQGNLADIIITDPPYNVAFVGSTKEHLTIQNDNFKSKSDFEQFLTNAFMAATANLKRGGLPMCGWQALEYQRR